MSIILYKAFISDYPNFKKLKVFSCKAVSYKIKVNHPITFKCCIRDKA
jgi:hypothetical protein